MAVMRDRNLHLLSDGQRVRYRDRKRGLIVEGVIHLGEFKTNWFITVDNVVKQTENSRYEKKPGDIVSGSHKHSQKLEIID